MQSGRGVSASYLNHASGDGESAGSSGGGEGQTGVHIRHREKTVFTSGRMCIPKVNRKNLPKDEEKVKENIERLKSEFMKVNTTTVAKKPKSQGTGRRGRPPKKLKLAENSNASNNDVTINPSLLVTPSNPSSSDNGKKTPARKAKKAAVLFMSGVDTDEADDIDVTDDDEFTITQERGKPDEVNDTSDDDEFTVPRKRRKTRSSQNRNLSRTLLDENAGSASEGTPCSSKLVLSSPKKIQTDKSKDAEKSSEIFAQSLPKEVPAEQSTDHESSRDDDVESSRESSFSTLIDSRDQSFGDKNDGESESPNEVIDVSVPSAEESLKFEIKPDDMVAFKPDGKWVDRPLVGKAVSVTSDFVHIVWYNGKYTSKWKMWGARQELEKDKISRDRMLTDGFQLTSSKKLPVKLAKHLRRLYLKIDKKV